MWENKRDMMKKKIFRVFQDVKANDKVEAFEIFMDDLDKRAFRYDMVRIQEDPFTDEEEATILELAGKIIYDLFPTSSIKEKKLLKKIEKITNR